MLFVKGEKGQAIFYVTKCRYCGRSFIKFHNKTMYCSCDCKKKSTQDNKAKYQRKRRKLINQGLLVSNETQYVGTGFLSGNSNSNFDIEYKHVRKELARIGIS